VFASGQTATLPTAYHTLAAQVNTLQSQVTVISNKSTNKLRQQVNGMILRDVAWRWQQQC